MEDDTSFLMLIQSISEILSFSRPLDQDALMMSVVKHSFPT
jgi:hypothetical protein